MPLPQSLPPLSLGPLHAGDKAPPVQLLLLEPARRALLLPVPRQPISHRLDEPLAAQNRPFLQFRPNARRLQTLADGRFHIVAVSLPPLGLIPARPPPDLPALQPPGS